MRQHPREAAAADCRFDSSHPRRRSLAPGAVDTEDDWWFVIAEVWVQENAQLIQELYAAFGRGNVPAILDLLTDDVVWYDPGPPDVPHAGSYSGRAGVGRFIASVGDTLEIDEFEPTEFLAHGDRVFVLGSVRAQVKERAARTTTNGRWSERCATAGRRLEDLRGHARELAAQARPRANLTRPLSRDLGSHQHYRGADGLIEQQQSVPARLFACSRNG